MKRNAVVKRNPRIIKRNLPMIELPMKNLGGYLPHPPDDCQKKEFWIQSFNTIWIDLSICHGCPDIKNCSTRINYLKFIKENRIL